MNLKSMACEYIEGCPEAFWEEELSRSVDAAGGFHWFHNKVYDCGVGTDGAEAQPDKTHGVTEVPYDRRVFHTAPLSRLSLGDLPVAYFASDIEDAVVETRREFRDPPVAQEVIDDFMLGEPGVGSEKKGFPLLFIVKPQVPVLDLRINPVATLSHCGGEAGEFLLGLLSSREPESVIATQALSVKAFARGFHGIMFKCVRPPDNSLKWSSCLVMFVEQSIQEYGLGT